MKKKDRTYLALLASLRARLLLNTSSLRAEICRAKPSISLRGISSSITISLATAAGESAERLNSNSTYGLNGKVGG